MQTSRVTLDDIHQTSRQALIQYGAADWVADAVAKAITQAEANGNVICGLYYLESYCVQMQSGRVDGQAEPVVTQVRPGAVNVDAKYGFAQAAFARGFDAAVASANQQGVCSYAISHAHTCTSLGYFTRQIAEAGLIGLGFTNAPACVAPPGGNQAVLGTNPIAFSVPARDGGVDFQFDQSTAAIAIGKIRMAASAGESIPPGWGIDKAGKDTTDPKQVLDGGSLLSSGGYKGYGFGLMAEVFAAAVTGSTPSVSAEPLKVADGGPHNLGQFYLLLDPLVFSGEAFWGALQTLRQAVDQQADARLPGSHKTQPESVEISAELWAQTQKLAGVGH